MKYKETAQKINTGETVLIGFNESMALTYQQGVIIGHYLERYRYYNMNFPQYIGEATELPATNWRDFYHKYMYLAKQLGGTVGFDAKYGYSNAGSFDTKINHIRFGPHNSYGGDIFAKCFYNKRADCDAMLDAMLKEAETHGIIINLTLGYSPGTGTSSYFGGDVCIIDSEPYKKYMQYCIDVINAYNHYKNLAIVDIFNEPATGDANSGNIKSYWIPKYGVTVDSNGYPTWENAIIAWQNRLINDVKTKVIETNEEIPHIIIGGGTARFVNYYHTPEQIASELAAVARYFTETDLMVGHPYNGAEDEYLYSWKDKTAKSLGKVVYNEEVGYNQTTSASPPAPGFYISYWNWADIIQNKYKFNRCWMQLNAMEAPTPIGGSYVFPKLPYPGYPVTQAMIDAIPPYATDAPPELKVVASATPMSGIVPLKVALTAVVTGGVEPYSYMWNFGATTKDANISVDKSGTYHLQLKVTDAKGAMMISNLLEIIVMPQTISIDVPPYDQGSVTTAVQSVNQALPNIVIPAQIVNSKVRIMGKDYMIVINIPSQTIIQKPVLINVPAQTIKLPVIDIPAFVEELPDKTS